MIKEKGKSNKAQIARLLRGSRIRSLYSDIAFKIAMLDKRKRYTPPVSLPTLISADRDAAVCFQAAVHNLTEINTVPCLYSVYNGTGLLRYPFMVRAGGNYHTPWTRDAAINTWQAVRFLDSEAARTTLYAVCTANEDGEPEIQPDLQTWDRIIWAVGAYEYYLATGDEDFLDTAYNIIGRDLEYHRKNRFNNRYRLFRGGSFFNDGISGYPLECHKKGLDDSFAPAHPAVEELMCLSTNCLFCEAYRIYSLIASHYGHEEEAEKARVFHDELKDTVNRLFLDENLGRYRYILFPDGHTDDSAEASGHAFAVLFDICPREKQPELIKKLLSSEYAALSVSPPFKGLYSDEDPGRHNNLIWPFLNGLLIQAAAKCGLHREAGRELEHITALYKGSDMEFYEIYSPFTGKAYGGRQLDRIWDSCHHQTWSASCYIGAVIHGIFGISTSEKGISFSPCVPESLGSSTLKGLKLQRTELTVEIKGWGTEIKSFLTDGKESEPFLPYDGKPHRIEITLSE